MENNSEVTRQEEEVKIITPAQLVMKRFLRNKLAIVGLYILAAMFLFVFVGPFFSPYTEYAIFYSKDGVELKGENIVITDMSVMIYKNAPPTWDHPLGTDRDGRDVLARLMYGGRVSMIIGLGVVLIELVLGVTLGGVAGYYGRWIDNIIMRLVDVFNSIPTLPIIMIGSSVMLSMAIPQNLRIYVLMVIIGVFGWPGVARVVRGQILSLREQEFMVAVEATGIKPRKRIFKHLIPNVMPQLIVIATLGIGGAILLESALSYLGFGLPFPYASWGNMVNAVNDPIVLRQHPNMWVPPGLAILLTVVAYNFVGDGLRDAFDPKMRR